MNNDVLAANLQHYIVALLGTSIDQYCIKTVKWQGDNVPHARGQCTALVPHL